MNFKQLIEEYKNFRKVWVKVEYDGKELDSFSIENLLPEDCDLDKIKLSIETV